MARTSNILDMVSDKIALEPGQYDIDDLAKYVASFYSKTRNAQGIRSLVLQIGRGFDMGSLVSFRNRILARERAKGYSWEQDLQTKNQAENAMLKRQLNVAETPKTNTDTIDTIDQIDTDTNEIDKLREQLFDEVDDGIAANVLYFVGETPSVKELRMAYNLIITVSRDIKKLNTKLRNIQRLTVA